MEGSHTIIVEFRLTRGKIFLILSLLFLAWRPGPLGSETLTLTTYYPAPYGGYVSILTTGNTFLARDVVGSGVSIGSIPTGLLPVAKLDIRGGAGVMPAIYMDHNQTVRSRGNMTLDADLPGILYLRNPGGVIVSNASGGPDAGNLTVLGRLKDVCRTIGYGGGTTSCSSLGPGIWTVVGHAGPTSSTVITIPILYAGSISQEVVTESESSGSMTCCRL